jgi:hypothetical protein
MEVSGQLHAQVALLPGKKPPVPIAHEAGWAAGQGRTNSQVVTRNKLAPTFYKKKSVG